MTTKQMHERYSRTLKFYIVLLIIFVLSTALFAGLAMYYHLKSNTYLEEASMICLISNKQTEILVETVPVYMNKSCADIQATSLKQGDKDYFCKTITSIKLPEKLDCSKI